MAFFEENQESHPITDSTIDRLRTESLILEKREPTWSDFSEVGKLSRKIQLELGLQVSMLANTEVETRFNRGEKGGVFAPETLPSRKPVFFHSHPEDRGIAEKSVVGMSPSYVEDGFVQFDHKDFGKSDTGLAGGGSLNIIKSYGVSFFVGKESHSNFARELNRRRNTANPVIIVRSGEFSGSIIDYNTPGYRQANHLGNQDNLLFTVRIPGLGIDGNMLFITHDRIKELGVTPKELCFGAGVNAVMEKLGYSEIPHTANLFDALRDPVAKANI